MLWGISLYPKELLKDAQLTLKRKKATNNCLFTFNLNKHLDWKKTISSGPQIKEIFKYTCMYGILIVVLHSYSWDSIGFVVCFVFKWDSLIKTGKRAEFWGSFLFGWFFKLVFCFKDVYDWSMSLLNLQ